MIHFQQLCRFLLTLLVKTGPSACLNPSATRPRPPNPFIDRFISEQATNVLGVEYFEARQVLKTDARGQPEEIVLFTSEGMGGGNSHLQFLTVRKTTASSQKCSKPVEAGGKMKIGVSLCRLDGNMVILDALTYAPTNPASCPSVKGEVSYALRARLKTVVEQASRMLAEFASAGGTPALPWIPDRLSYLRLGPKFGGDSPGFCQPPASIDAKGITDNVDAQHPGSSEFGLFR